MIVDQKKPAFEELYSRYYSNMLFYTLRKVGNREEAEDLVADAFAYCLDHYDRYDPAKSNVKTWLYLVLNSRIKNHYRDRKDTVDVSELENLLCFGEDEMIQSVWLQQLRDSLAKAIARLPERQQQVVILRYFKNLSSAEIGERLGISAGNARVLLSRALDALGQGELGNTLP